MNLLKIFTKTQPSFPSAKTKYPTRLAFVCGGVEYYEFVDKNNMPATRGLEAITFYQELQNGVTNDFLKAWQEAQEKVLSDPKKINVNEIVKLNLILKDRLNYTISKDIIYKLASVAFFAKDENPETYDFAYNETKIKHWKEHGGGSFFLSEPMMNLIPFLKQYGSFSQTYLEAVEKIEKAMKLVLQAEKSEAELKNESD
jgi:hypothetical protein